jgi:hypothetical protein
MADLVDTTLKVICLSVFARIVEVGSLQSLLDFVNSVLLKVRLPIPPTIVKNVNLKFGTEFDKVRREVKKIVTKTDFDSIPQLQYIEPKYKGVLVGSSPRCIGMLLYGNKVNVDLTSKLLDICDQCVLDLEIVSCTVVLVPSGCMLKSHRSEYCGVMTYIVVIEGSTLTHLQVGNQNMTLTTKASVFYDPTSVTTLENMGPSMAILLKIEVYRPFDFGMDAVNWSTLHVMSESEELQYVCKMSMIE